MKKVVLGLTGFVVLCLVVYIFVHISKERRVERVKKERPVEKAKRSEALKKVFSPLKKEEVSQEHSEIIKFIHPFEEAIKKLDEAEFNCSDYEELLIYALIKGDEELEEKIKERLEKGRKKYGDIIVKKILKIHSEKLKNVKRILICSFYFLFAMNFLPY